MNHAGLDNPTNHASIIVTLIERDRINSYADHTPRERDYTTHLKNVRDSIPIMRPCEL
jgi:hypothetical protein